MSKRLTIEEFIKTLKTGSGSGSGGNSGSLLLRITEASENRTTYNHTWQEVYDAVAAGVPVLVNDDPPVNKPDLDDIPPTVRYWVAGEIEAFSGLQFTVRMYYSHPRENEALLADLELLADTADGYLYEIVNNNDELS